LGASAYSAKLEIEELKVNEEQKVNVTIL